MNPRGFGLLGILRFPFAGTLLIFTLNNKIDRNIRESKVIAD